MLQLFYRQESKVSRYLIGRYLVGIYFSHFFQSLFYLWMTSFAHLNSPLYAKAFASLLHHTYWHISHLSPPNTSCLPCEHLLRALPAPELWTKKCLRRMCCSKWQDWIECVQFGREWNNYLPKAGKLNAHSKVIEINSDSGFFLPVENMHRENCSQSILLGS